MKRLLTIALLFVAQSSQASMFFQGFSHHFKVDGLNENNTMMIVDSDKYIGGWFTNSYNNSTFIAGRKLNLSNDYVEVGVIGSVMYTPETYYIENICENKKWCLAPVPYIKASYDIGAIGLIISPEVTTIMIGVNF